MKGPILLFLLATSLYLTYDVLKYRTHDRITNCIITKCKITRRANYYTDMRVDYVHDKEYTGSSHIFHSPSGCPRIGTSIPCICNNYDNTARLVTDLIYKEYITITSWLIFIGVFAGVIAARGDYIR